MTCDNINIPIYKEPHFTYNKIPYINIDFKINGYFQSPKYFQKYYKTNNRINRNLINNKN